MIAWSLYTTFIGAFLLLLLPRGMARWIALLTAVTGLVISCAAFFGIQNPGTLQDIVRIPWIPALGGMSFHLAADGISLTMAVVTGLTGVGAILFSWNVDRRQNEFFFWLLLVIGGSYGVFLSADIFLFFVFYELVIIPKYLLIATWGSTNKAYGAMKLTLYSFFGGALILIALVPTCLAAGTTDIQQLSAHVFSPAFQAWAFPMMFLGFAVLAGMWPVHTWAPTGHSAAPTAGSMLLAGVVMKLGAYGALRLPMNLFPDGYQSWRGAIGILAIIGICYAAGVALRQRDLKFVIGYSSVSHMGFVLLGLATAQRLGIGGAVLQMFSHGVIAGLLFAVAGRMIYERSHTRDLHELSEMKLSRAIPFAAFTFVVASAASMGIPGFSGFAAEITILIGLWHAYPILVPVAGVGMALTAAFTLRALRYSFFGEKSASPPLECPPITFAEKSGAILLMASTLAVGLYPKLLLDRILPCVDVMRFLKP
jgi:NADH-quinone oxidoreductase subunit M